MFGGFNIELDAQPRRVGAPRVPIGPFQLLREQLGGVRAGPPRHLLHADIRRRHAERHARGRGNRTKRVMRDDVYVVRFGPVSDFQGLGQASHNAKVDSSVIDQVLFNNFPERPFGRPLFPGGQGQVHLPAQIPVTALIFRTYRVFNKKWLELFEVPAHLDDVRGIESRVDVERYLDLGSDSLSDPAHLFDRDPHRFDRF